MKREDWYRRYGAVDNLWASKPNRFLVAEVEDLPAGRALDLACGEGQNAIWLATRGWSVTGVDYSEVAIAKAQARGERDGVDVDFAYADLVEYVPEPGAYRARRGVHQVAPGRERDRRRRGAERP